MDPLSTRLFKDIASLMSRKRPGGFQLRKLKLPCRGFYRQQGKTSKHADNLIYSSLFLRGEGRRHSPESSLSSVNLAMLSKTPRTGQLVHEKNVNWLHYYRIKSKVKDLPINEVTCLGASACTYMFRVFVSGWVGRRVFSGLGTARSVENARLRTQGVAEMAHMVMKYE